MGITIIVNNAPPPRIAAGTSVERTAALKETIRILGGESFPGCESPWLRLNKLVRVGGDSKRAEVEALVACHKNCATKYKFKAQEVAPRCVLKLAMRLEGRLIVNQAGGLLENAGLCLHPHFGYPYIPGSAVKGAARHEGWRRWHEAEDGEEKLAAARLVADVFGYPTGNVGLDGYLEEKAEAAGNPEWIERRSGKVVFFAAMPERPSETKLVMEITNSHHMKYYSGNKDYAAAYDDEQPNPQVFPAVEKGADFSFTIAPLKGADDGLLKDAKKLLVGALEFGGVGAKTAAGFGRFVNLDASNVQADEEKTAELREMSATKLKKEVKELAVDNTELTICRAYFDVVRDSDWWTKEKNNGGSKITKTMNELSKRFGVKL